MLQAGRGRHYVAPSREIVTARGFPLHMHPFLKVSLGDRGQQLPSPRSSPRALPSRCSEPARALASLDPRHADGGARRALEPVAARPPHGVRLNWRRRRVTTRCGGGRWAAPQAPAPRQGGAALAAIARCARPVAGARSRTTRAAAAPLRRGHPSHSSSSHAGRARAALGLELVPYPPHPARA